MRNFRSFPTNMLMGNIDKSMENFLSCWKMAVNFQLNFFPSSCFPLRSPDYTPSTGIKTSKEEYPQKLFIWYIFVDNKTQFVNRHYSTYKLFPSKSISSSTLSIKIKLKSVFDNRQICVQMNSFLKLIEMLICVRNYFWMIIIGSKLLMM
jgi:hypothetical protein